MAPGRALGHHGTLTRTLTREDLRIQRPRPNRQQIERTAIACGVVVATAVVLQLTDADSVVATSVFLIVVVLTALLGSPAGPTALVLTCIAFNLWFVPPVGSLIIRVVDDVAPLAAFVVAAVTCQLIVARLDRMRRQAEEHEQAAFDAELEAAISQNRAAFLSSMTHNLRTPLASIKAAAATLGSPTVSVPDDTRRRLVATIHDEADRLERLVTKVLELSRVHAGSLQAQPEPTDIADLTAAAVQRLRHVAGATDVRLEVGDDPLFASVDPELLEVVLVSLLENALRFAPQGTPVWVRARTVDGQCELRVVDHGPGIATADRDRVFDEFVRLDAEGSGAGLGLAIARAFVDAQHGTLTVEASDGGGATFVVRIPTTEPIEQATATPTERDVR